MLLLTVKLAEKHVKINQPGNTTSPSVSEEFFKFGNNTTFQKVSTWADKWQTKQKKKNAVIRTLASIFSFSATFTNLRCHKWEKPSEFIKIFIET